MNKILVTGGSGFIGSNLIKKLIDNKNFNISLTSLDNYLTSTKENHVEGVRYIEGNTWDAEEIFKDEKFDIIYHFGEYSRIAYSFDDIKLLNESFLRGTPVILDLAKKWNSILIYSATSSAIGNEGKDSNLSPYAWMKTKMIEYIENYHNWFGLRYHIVHFFNVYGPGQINTGKFSTVIGIFENQYNNKEDLTVVKPGTQKRDFVHIDDVVDGLIRVKDTTYINHKWYFNTNIHTSIVVIA